MKSAKEKGKVLPKDGPGPLRDDVPPGSQGKEEEGVRDGDWQWQSGSGKSKTSRDELAKKKR